MNLGELSPGNNHFHMYGISRQIEKSPFSVDQIYKKMELRVKGFFVRDHAKTFTVSCLLMGMQGQEKKGGQN